MFIISFVTQPKSFGAPLRNQAIHSLSSLCLCIFHLCQPYTKPTRDVNGQLYPRQLDYQVTSDQALPESVKRFHRFVSLPGTSGNGGRGAEIIVP